MKIIVWNCQGIGGPLTVSSLKEQVRLQAPDIVVLLETKNNAYRYGWLQKQLGMNFLHVVAPKGLSGGLCMFWKEAQNVVLVKYANFLIEVGVHDIMHNFTWRFFAVYASTDDGVRRKQLGVLQDRINTCGEGCLVMGDFNDILDVTEKDGGRPRTIRSMYDFRRFVSDSHLLDLGYEGYPYTWRNRREDGGIQERLDRGFANESWLRSYPDARVVHQVVPGSDHAMLVLHTSVSLQRRASRFIFDQRWGELERCQAVVKERWCRGFKGSKGMQVFEKLKWVRKGLVDWKRQEWRSSKVCIDNIKEELCTALQSSVF